MAHEYNKVFQIVWILENTAPKNPDKYPDCYMSAEDIYGLMVGFFKSRMEHTDYDITLQEVIDILNSREAILQITTYGDGSHNKYRLGRYFDWKGFQPVTS